VAGNAAEARLAELRNALLSSSGLTGRSSTLRLLDLIVGVHGLLDAPPARGMTAGEQPRPGAIPAFFFVIARSEATKQSILELRPDGLLRFARNDV
jgi:hypothetical protein